MTHNTREGIEEELEEDYESDKVFDCFDGDCEECTVCKYLNFREWAEGCAPSGSTIERNPLVEDYLKRKDATLNQELQKAREEERERIKGLLQGWEASERTNFDSDEEYQLHIQKVGAINWYTRLVHGWIDDVDQSELDQPTEKETMTQEELEAEGDWEENPEKPFEIEMQ